MLAGIALGLHRGDWALGFFLGIPASLLNLAGLEKLSRQVLAGNLGGSLSFFWFFNLGRLGLLFLACWLFWEISPGCFLGGALSYFWCLAVLLTLALRARRSPKIS